MSSVLLEAQNSTSAPQRTAPHSAPEAGRVGRWAVAAALVLAGATLAWSGGGMGLAGAVLACAGAAWAAASWQTQRRTQHPGDESASPARNSASAEPGVRIAASSRVGAELMVENVVPVWSRQMDVTREATAEGLGQLLNSFAEMSGALQTISEGLGAYTVRAQPGAVDDAVRRERPALDALNAASQRAFDERDHAVQLLSDCTEGLQRLQELAKQARELGRQTRMMAFNASIEANRSRTQTDGATQAVASEARMLAARMAEAGEQIDAEVASMLSSMRTAHREASVKTTSPEELRLEIDLQARKALTLMLGAVGAVGAVGAGGAVDASGTLGGQEQRAVQMQQASLTLKDQLDAAFVHFQFGDRVSQMLAIVGNDMNNFAQWVAEHPRATQTDAAQWLAALEGSYTMEEQRSSHHGNVHVQQGSGVEFF